MTTVTLTFDNGPHELGTPSVLETLDRYGLKATFFVIGECVNAPGGLDLARSIVSRGHWIGNHTFTHRVPLGELRNPAKAIWEIEENQRLLNGVAHPDRLFRPSGGGGHLDRRLLNKAAVEHLQRRGYTCVLWNCVPRDWENPDGWVDRALEAIGCQDWSLVVLHDAVPQAMRHLDRFLDELLSLGTEFRQDFPDQCVPIRRGQVRQDLTPFVAESRRPRS